MNRLLRRIRFAVADIFGELYATIANALSALNPIRLFYGLFTELFAVVGTLFGSIGEGLGSLTAVPRWIGGFLYGILRFIVTLPLEMLALIGIGKRRSKLLHLRDGVAGFFHGIAASSADF